MRTPTRRIPVCEVWPLRSSCTTRPRLVVARQAGPCVLHGDRQLLSGTPRALPSSRRPRCGPACRGRACPSVRSSRSCRGFSFATCRREKEGTGIGLRGPFGYFPETPLSCRIGHSYLHRLRVRWRRPVRSYSGQGSFSLTVVRAVV